MTLSAPRRTRLVSLTSFFLVGIGLGSWRVMPLSLAVLLFSGLVLWGSGVLFRSYVVSLVCLASIALLGGYCLAQVSLRQATLAEPEDYSGLARVVSVRMTEPPNQRVLLRLEEGRHRGRLVRTYVYDWPYSVGMQIKVAGNIEPSRYSSDYGAYIIGTTTLFGRTEEVSRPQGVWWVRSRLEVQLGSSLPEPYASLALGLITGAGDHFDAGFKDDLQRTGTTHIVAVSGYNLTIVALLLRRLGQRWGRWWGLSLAVMSIVGYVVLAGGTPSMLRGASVAFLSLAAIAYGRVTHRLPLVLLSAVLLSLITPLGMVYSLSWQLSFLAFVGILFWPAVLEPLLTKRGGFVGGLFTETLSAEIMVVPLLLYRFGVLSVISPFVNVAVLSLVPLAMGVSALQSVVSLVWLPLGRGIAWFTYPLLWLIVKPIVWASELPFAAVSLRLSVWLLILFYSVLCVIFWYLARRGYDQS